MRLLGGPARLLTDAELGLLQPVTRRVVTSAKTEAIETDLVVKLDYLQRVVTVYTALLLNLEPTYSKPSTKIKPNNMALTLSRVWASPPTSCVY